jgi:UPF0755 protein
LVAAVAFTAWGLFSPAAPHGESRVFTVAPGESVSSVARRLGAEGLLPDRALFRPRLLVLWARLSGADRQIKAGEYDLSPTLTPVQILGRLRSGTVRTVAVMLAEGLRVDEVAERLEAAGITPAALFVERATDPAFAESLGVEADALEGYLYPETYRFRRGTPADDVLRTLVEEFRKRWTSDDRRRLEASDRTLHEVLTIASLVEKETSVPEERPLVAAVFENRLKRRMRLQSDPTVIYGILHTRGHFEGNLRKRDLREDTPYNTYTRRGLPPGPIANPTIGSVRAVLSPADVPYLYFVSRNDGTHAFSRSLKEHMRAVDRYQRRGRRRAAPSQPANADPD